MLILCHLMIWRAAQVLNKKDLSFRAGATKTSSALVDSPWCMLGKSIFMHSKQKEVRSSAQIFNLSWSNSQDWIYNCRFWYLKGCKRMKNNKFYLKKKFLLSWQNFSSTNYQFINLPWYLRWHLLYASVNFKGCRW